MIKAKLTEEMTETIKNAKNQNLCSYEYGKSIKNEAYGNLQINLNSFAIELINEEDKLPFYDTTEDISFFKCTKKQLDEKYVPYCPNEPIEKHGVDEKILATSVIEDCISINNGEYNITFDMAIIFETENHKYVFSRGWFFDETISISIDKEFDDIYPVSQVVEDWSDEGDNKVEIKRSKIYL